MMDMSVIDLLQAIAIGDALGSTSEFHDSRNVVELYRNVNKSGWPFRQYGAPWRDLAPGAYTDDTEMAIELVKGNKNPEKIAENFLTWMLSSPKDIGGTCRGSLQILEREESPFWIGGKEFYNMYPEMISNGSLMRNGVIAAMSDNLYNLYTLSLQHGMITHYHPMTQLCCMAQTYIQHMMLCDKFVWDAWVVDFLKSVRQYLYDFTCERCILDWLNIVNVSKAMEDFESANWDMTKFNPYREDFRFRTGHALFSLQIAVWGLYHATHNTDLKNPTGYPSRVFRAMGLDRIAWIAMLGYDSDTYCAIAAPMMVAAGLRFSKELSQSVKLPSIIC